MTDDERPSGRGRAIWVWVVGLAAFGAAGIQISRPTAFARDLEPVVPPEQRGRIDAERAGFHDAANIRTVFYNFGMVGDYPPDPINVDLSVFHSAEVPRGSGMNYCDGVTPFVLAKIPLGNGIDSTFIVETGYRERQGISPLYNRDMRFEPRPGYFEPAPHKNVARSPAVSNDPRTWPQAWPDKTDDPDDPGWSGSWNGYFGKRSAADQESFTVMDDDFYDAWAFRPDSRDSTRRGLGLRVEVRGFQWSNPQASNVIFWHYDITNEGTTDYRNNIIFGLYMDSGVGGSAVSCDGIPESDDDNAFFDKSSGLNLVYTWDKDGHGVDLSGPCGKTGYLGYAYLETPGNAVDGLDNDGDGILNEQRDGGAGERIAGRDEIIAQAGRVYDLAKFQEAYGPIERRPAYKAGVWWTGDEDMDWVADPHDLGADGVAETGDTGEGDSIPTAGEPYFDQTDLHESDQIGLTGFKMNRIRAGQGNDDTAIDDILFWTNDKQWPRRLYEHFTNPNLSARFDSALAANYNIAFLFASGPFTLEPGQTERFSLALAYGGNLRELRNTVKVVQQIYNANYQFAVPPSLPTLTAESGDGFVRLSWDDVAERAVDPVTFENDFEGYRIYRATDPEFRDVRVITTGTGTGPIGNGRPIAQFDLVDSIAGFSDITVEGVAYFLGDDTGITHTWTDSTVTNGQLYYYALTAYDFGSDSLASVSASSDSFQFYPSENAIAVSRTPRGGIILPPNVVSVRPEPKVAGFLPAEADAIVHLSGTGSGAVEMRVVNSGLVPDGHTFQITFATPTAESIRAETYSLVDSTLNKAAFTKGKDLAGEGIGPIGFGFLPIIDTPPMVSVDTSRSEFSPESQTTVELEVTYLLDLPINQRRPGYPDDITITFSDQPLDTAILSFPARQFPSRPAKMRVVAHGTDRDRQLDFRLRDQDGDSTLSAVGDFIDVFTYPDVEPPDSVLTWRVEVVSSGQAASAAFPPPTIGDVYEIRLSRPFSADDVLQFRTRGERVDGGQAAAEPLQPYVVPNPYVGSASFEPERFAVSGRGERRLEFRGVPRNATVRIYTVHGDLVETLVHDGSNDAFVPWDLRTRDNLDVAPGLYVYHVDAGAQGTSVGKFAVIK